LFSTLLLGAALLQAAPPATAPAEEPPVTRLTRAFTSCLREKLPAVPATLSPEAGADHLIKECEAERAALAAHLDEVIARVPQAEQAAARAEVEAGLAEGRAGIVQAIVRQRQVKSR
jgi:hypothetical protein